MKHRGDFYVAHLCEPTDTMMTATMNQTQSGVQATQRISSANSQNMIRSLSRIVSVVLVLSFASACSAPPTKAPRSQPPAISETEPRVTASPRIEQKPTQPTTPEPRDTVASRPTLAEIQTSALQLEPGMSRDRVQTMLGTPDETASRTYGAATGRPWLGLEWTYAWKQGYSTRRLVLVFQSTSNGWLLNGWDWRNY